MLRVIAPANTNTMWRRVAMASRVAAASLVLEPSTPYLRQRKMVRLDLRNPNLGSEEPESTAAGANDGVVNLHQFQKTENL